MTTYQPIPHGKRAWTLQTARDTYNVAHWGSGYVDINDAGEVVVRVDPAAPAASVSLHRLTQDFAKHNLSLPVLVRFSGILSHRVETLCKAFDGAMAQDGYRGRYTAVYPIKVNQQRSVVDALLAHGGERLGLEAGSKPELLAVLARSHPEGIVVCNGYKDREFIRLALIGKQLNHRVYIVVEKLAELEAVVREARALNVSPLLGVRVRLASIGAGKWQNTGGEKSKFGLSAAEVLRVIERLRAENMLDSLQMMHFHMGSQVANIQNIQSGMKEAARYYAELKKMGAPVRVINVGGGLGVDYEGTRSRSFCSMNYSVEEYAHNIVHALWEICTERNLPHPDVISESGRALTAHHAVLITNVLDVERLSAQPVSVPQATEPQIIQDLWKGLQSLDARPALEVYHDAVHWLNEAQTMFNHGVLSLNERARVEQIYFATCREVRARLDPSARAHREALDELNEKLADKYFCNFSLFQSMPDHWAIDQIFPVLPLSRLNEEPVRRAVLQDITCDSDGRVDLYVDGEGVETSLPLHLPEDGVPYLLGIFMVGAYQEILGDMHNLFGDTDSAHVEVNADGRYELTDARRGDTVDSVLRFVSFNPEDLLASYQSKVAAATWLNVTERETCLRELSEGLEGYTYLED
jgi:arginine decarboxylase